MTTLFLALAWLVPTSGLAAPPTIDDAMLEKVDADQLASFSDRRDQLGRLDRQIQAAELKVDEAKRTVDELKDAMTDAKRDVQSAQGDVSEARAGGKSRVEMARHAVEEAKISYDASVEALTTAKTSAKEAKKAKESERIQETRLALVAAKEDATAAKADLRDAKLTLKRTKKDVSAEIADVKDTVGDAREVTDAAREERARAKTSLDLARAEVKFLQTKRTMLASELEFDRASAAADNGAVVEILSYQEAVVKARDAYTKAKTARDDLATSYAQMSPVEPAAGPAPTSEKAEAAQDEDDG